MTREEAKARWLCCPMCDKAKCEREADDCDVKIYLETRVVDNGVSNDRTRRRLYRSNG